MSSARPEEWRAHLADLLADLQDSGALTDPQWVDAFTAVPRHLFVPEVTDQRAIYRDESLVVTTHHHYGLGTEIPTSSSTRPALMARMLELLDVHNGMSVLEIGTGTGYNAGLLSHRLGAQRVSSIDIDAAMVDRARRALHTLGYEPHLVAGDGTGGVTNRAPFDRIIATCAVPAIPRSWITQLAPGGKMLVNLRGEIAGGTLCLLTKDESGDDEVIGPFLDVAGHFMWARHETDETLPYGVRPVSERDQTRGNIDPSAVSAIADDLDDPDFRFLAQLHIRGIRLLTHVDDESGGTTIRAETTDGSWARASTTGRAAQGGERRLWDSLAAAHSQWHEQERPGPTRFGVVANPTIQFVYLDHDDNWTRWPLPLL